MGLSIDKIVAELVNLVDPYLGHPLIQASNIQKSPNGGLSLSLCLGYPVNEAYQTFLKEQIQAFLDPVLKGETLDIHVTWKIQAHMAQKNVKPQKNIKNIIAIASGKGGVGKSTLALNVALGLQAQGAQVGLLDADIYGPSQAKMLGVELSSLRPGKTLVPQFCYGLQTMSIAYLIDEQAPAIWRGPMVSRALEQLLQDTAWDQLDYLIIDLPPGTGDIQLTLAQKLPLNGVVIVTTPQAVACIDAQKALRMFEKLSIPILGVVENMSSYTCGQCGTQSPLFGMGGGARLAEQFKLPLLAKIPFEQALQTQSDQGRPLAVLDPLATLPQLYEELARHMAARITLQEIDYRACFPNIVLQES